MHFSSAPCPESGFAIRRERSRWDLIGKSNATAICCKQVSRKAMSGFKI